MPQVPYHIELDREEDGRWIADIAALPGVMAYGKSKDEAIQAAIALALRVLADQVEHGEDEPARYVPGLFVHA